MTKLIRNFYKKEKRKKNIKEQIDILYIHNFHYI